MTVTTPRGTSKAGGGTFRYGDGPARALGGLDTAGYCEQLGFNGKRSGGPAKLAAGAISGPGYAFENWACEQAGGSLTLIGSGGPAPSEDGMSPRSSRGCSFAYAEEVDSAYSWYCFEPQPAGEPAGASPRPTIAPATTGTPTARTAATIPAPVLAVSGNVAPLSGVVLVRLPGASGFVPLSSLRQIPFGTVIDATRGHVGVTTAGPHGGTQTGEFFAGEFVLRQGRSGLVVAELTGGSFAGCPTARERSHLARASTVRLSASRGAQTVGQRARQLLDSRQLRGGRGRGHGMADGGPVRRHADQGHARQVAVTDLVNRRTRTVKVGHKLLVKAP